MTESGNTRKTIEQRRIIVHGLVQGVGYRYFASRSARRHGVSGWARNLADGTVEVIAQGSPDELDAFEHDLREGPSVADVSEIEVSITTVDTELSGFREQ